MVQERDDIVGLDAGILMHPQVWVDARATSGSFSDPLVECADGQPALPARRAARHGGPDRDRQARPERRRAAKPAVPRRTADRSAPPRRFNLMFKTFMGPVEDDAAIVVPAAGDGAGHRTSTSRTSSSRRARSCPSASPRSARASATRSAPATSSSGCASSSRWRCSTSCRPGGGAHLRGVAAAALGVVHRLRRDRRAAALPRARPRRAGPLRQEGDRRRVPLPVRLEGARGHPQPGRLRPEPPPAGERREPRVLRPGHRTSTSCPGSSRRPAARTARRSRS